MNPTTGILVFAVAVVRLKRKKRSVLQNIIFKKRFLQTKSKKNHSTRIDI
jgi:hypothetical protein